jgi:hypothetical protein
MPLYVGEMVSSAFHWPELIIRVISVTLALGVRIAIILRHETDIESRRVFSSATFVLLGQLRYEDCPI